MKFIKDSIGLKIFSVVILIVIVMVSVSVVNVRLESRVGQALDRVSNRYIVAYGSLARANLRSVEQALNIRGIFITHNLLMPDSVKNNLEEQVKIKGKQFWEEIALFHEMIGQELRESDYLIDVTLLARIDEKVIGIETTQKFFESEYQRFIEGFKKAASWIIGQVSLPGLRPGEENSMKSSTPHAGLCSQLHRRPPPMSLNFRIGFIG